MAGAFCASMTYNPFERRRGSIFSLRTAPNDPDRYSARLRDEKRRESITASLPTLFDLQDYLVKTKRGNLMPEIHRYDKDAVEDALMDDLRRSPPEAVKDRMRALILAAATNAFPKPELPAEEATAHLTYLRGRILNEKNIRRSSSDDTEMEDHAIMLCDNARNYILNPKNANLAPDAIAELLNFLERVLHDENQVLKNSRNIQVKIKSAEMLRHIRLGRNAAYWRYLYADAVFPKQEKIKKAG